MCDQVFPVRSRLIQGWLTPKIACNSLLDFSTPSRLIHLTSSSVSLAFVGPPVATTGTPRRCLGAQVFLSKIWLTVVNPIPNSEAISLRVVYPHAPRRCIRSTCSFVSFALTPSSLPLTDECTIFSLGVHHSRFDALLSTLLKLMWFTCVSSGSGWFKCVRATSLCSLTFTGLVPGSPYRLTWTYPSLSRLLDRTLPFIRYVPFFQLFNFILSSDLTLPRSDTSYRPTYPGTGSQTSSSTSNLSVGLSPSLRLLTKRCGYFCRARNSSTARRINSATATSFCKANSRSFSRIGAGR